MKILFLTHSFNSLTQRLFVELGRDGHQISIEYDIHDDVTREAVELFRPDLILAPFLKRAIPREVWERVPCLVVHPGIPGDRGPSSLDWAILEGQQEWGVTVLQANEVMDGGDIWAWAGFPMRDAPKSSLYRREVTEAAVRAVRDAIQNFQTPGYRPRKLDPLAREVRGAWHPTIRQEDRRIDWQADTTVTVLRKIRSADSSPGVLTRIAVTQPDGTAREAEVHLFGAHPEAQFKGRPGHVLGQSESSICVGTQDGAIWITHLRPKRGDRPELKLPANQVLTQLAGQAVAQGLTQSLTLGSAGLPDAAHLDIRYSEEGAVGSIYFPFYNGAMSTRSCERLRETYEYATTRPTKIIVLWGGEDFWSNGIDLNQIECSPKPAEESWRNIQAMDDLVERILLTESHLTVAAIRGNAGAGGVFLALALDQVFARDGVTLNPHYKNMGNLYGSEFWTYLVPKRVSDPARRAVIQGLRLPLGVKEACELGLVDEVLAGDPGNFEAQVRERVRDLCDSERFSALLASKREGRERDETEKPLRQYREEELKRMRLNFFGFDPSYHVARYNFVYRVPHSKTPLHLARHRAAGPKKEGRR